MPTMPKTLHRRIGKRLLRALAALLFPALLSLHAWAGEPTATLGDLAVVQPWARASIGPAKSGVAYLAISNEGEVADRLIEVRTPMARRAALHRHAMADGVMKMRPVEAIELAPGERAVLAPGGLHVMLMGLGQPLEEGQHFPLTLVFERAGSLEVQVTVRGATAMTGGMSGD